MQLRLATRSVRFHVGELKKLALAFVINYMDRDVCGFSTSVQQYLDCAGRAAMSSFRMAAVSRLVVKRQTLISIST